MLTLPPQKMRDERNQRLLATEFLARVLRDLPACPCGGDARVDLQQDYTRDGGLRVDARYAIMCSSCWAQKEVIVYGHRPHKLSTIERLLRRWWIRHAAPAEGSA